MSILNVYDPINDVYKPISLIGTNYDSEIANINSQLSDVASLFTSVKKFGAKGDGLTDDTVAIQTALNYCKTQFQAGYIVTLTVPYGTYKITSTISIDGYIDSNALTCFNLKMDGYFVSPNGIGKLLSIKNCTGCELSLRVKGLAHTSDHLIYSTDFSTNVPGLDVILYLENCSYTSILSFYAKRWFGRGIEAKNCSTNNWGLIRGDMVGQMLYINSTSGFGTIGSVWVTEYMGSYFKSTDLTIQYYENMILNTSVKKAIVFDSCVSLWAGTMNVGNNSDDYEVKIISCSNVNIRSMYIYGKNTSPTDYCAGLYIFQSYAMNINLNTAYIKGNALYIEGIKGSYIKVVDTFSDNIGTVTTNANYGAASTTLDIVSRYRNGTGLIVQKGSGGQTIDNLSIAINAKDRNASNSDATDLKVVDSDSGVTILPNTNANTIDLPETNVARNVAGVVNTFTNLPKSDTTVKLVMSTATTSLSGYSIKSTWNNTICRQSYNVVGSVALTNATNNGNITSGNVLATFDKLAAPSLPVIIPALVKLSTGVLQLLDCSVEWSAGGTLIKALSNINTSNISQITLNFAYECEL